MSAGFSALYSHECILGYAFKTPLSWASVWI